MEVQTGFGRWSYVELSAYESVCKRASIVLTRMTSEGLAVKRKNSFKKLTVSRKIVKVSIPPTGFL